MISKEEVNLRFVQRNTRLDEVVAVTLSCPECDFDVKVSLMDEGLREVHYCRNYDCEKVDFEVSDNTVRSYYLRHTVENIKEKSPEGDGSE